MNEYCRHCGAASFGGECFTCGGDNGGDLIEPWAFAELLARKRGKKLPKLEIEMKAKEVCEPMASFGPLVETCKAHGIGRTTAFQLAKDGLIETFCIGTRRYVKLESLRTLPGRLAGVR